MKDTDAFDDFYELGIEVGVIKKSRHRRTIEYFNGTYRSDVDTASIRQLNVTSNLFGQGGK